jgi:hypothetical protein
VLSETVLVLVIGKQRWLTKWALDPCGIFNSLVAKTMLEGLRVRVGAGVREIAEMNQKLSEDPKFGC